jgi:hypothetical protein
MLGKLSEISGLIKEDEDGCYTIGDDFIIHRVNQLVEDKYVCQESHIQIFIFINDICLHHLYL